MAVAAMLTATAAASAPPAPLVQFKALAITPDGRHVAAVETLQDADSAVAESHGAVVVRDAAGRVTARFDPCATCTYAGIGWSPDGGSLAFVATDAAKGTADLMVAGGTVRTVARIDGVAQSPRWSPDGRQLAFLAVYGAHKAVGAVEAGRAQVGEIGEADDEQRIVVVDAAGGRAIPVSPADTWVYEFDWTPAGGFVATAAKGNGDNNWWVAKLVAIEGGAMRDARRAGDAACLAARRSPMAGSWFIGGLMSDFGATGGDLYAVPLAGGSPVDLTPGATFSVTSLAMTGRDPLVTRQAGDRFEIARVAGDGRMTLLWSAPVSGSAGDSDSGVAVSADGGTIASVVSDFAHPAEIAIGHGALRPVTRVNAGHPAFVTARSLTWTSEGRHVQGWLLTPLTAHSGKRAMIVDIHGGPSSFAGPQYLWNGVDRAMIDHGYAVFQPNPRGSYGQGEAFTRANIRDFGGGDLRDILAGVDAVLASRPSTMPASACSATAMAAS